MKKEYISPFAVYVMIECNAMIAASEKVEIETDGPGGAEHLGNKKDGSWGNLWNK
ncbi:MAG: hypothetical protein IJC92_03495 [Bacteroidaceae bacterium]|nr:hypothetical protein [Bacteroidaceae bacterium]